MLYTGRLLEFANRFLLTYRQAKLIECFFRDREEYESLLSNLQKQDPKSLYNPVPYITFDGGKTKDICPADYEYFENWILEVLGDCSPNEEFVNEFRQFIKDILFERYNNITTYSI
jgi:hypothetical protein